VVDLTRLKALSGEVAVTGVAATPYAQDHAAAKAGERLGDHYAFGARALKAALADAEVDLGQVDGIVAGTPLVYDRLCEIVGIDPRWGVEADINSGIQHAALAIHAGMASCVALVYGNAQRSMGTEYGGPSAAMADAHMAYTYYAPYGFTSQGGIYAMVTQRMLADGRFTADELAQVAIAQRGHAALNEDAVMREPIDLDTYRAARYIAEPLRIYDYCLVNDGGVALIVQRRDLVEKKGPHAVIGGMARADATRGANSLRPRLIDFFETAYRHVAATVFEVADVDPSDLSALEVYDSFSIHVPMALEGLGLCPPGKVGAFLEAGEHALGGRLPTNTHGGHLNEAYMQGWGHQVEAVRQVRRTCGPRQVPDASHVLYASGGAGTGVGVLYSRSED
jgi:acetyl-CoA acetyltransferase